MNKSSKRGIFLSITLLFSVLLMVIPSDAYANEINVESVALEETTIIKLTNDSVKEISMLRIWLGNDVNFKSFKTEKGWIGESTPQGVIIFTSTESIKPGESVKFGIKTDKAKPGINWKALDETNTQLSIGKVLPKEMVKIGDNQNQKFEQTPGDTGTSISTESNFRIIPNNPNAGSSIRVTGDKFGPSQEFDFYIDSQKLGSFTTDENGHFMTTMKISKEQKADRVDFKVKDKEGKEKKISLRLGENNDRIPLSNIDLTIKGIPKVIYRGDFLEIFGTGQPNSAITAKISNPDGEVINTRSAEINSKGEWKLNEPIIVALDAPFGEYSGVISDGRDEIFVEWTIKSNKFIIITPSTLKYQAGETMKFSGTALPNKLIEIVLEDPLGKEIFSDIIQINKSGLIEFEYKTEQTALEGTYTVIATQEKYKEFIFAGLGQLPTIPVNLEFDQLNYKSGDTAVISLVGKASDIISLLIIDPSDKPKGEAISIKLQPDGRGTHSIKLDGYTSGVYAAVISKGSTQSTETFTVGLKVSSGEIKINTTKIDYNPGDSILILGDTNSNVLLTITMTDSDGNEIKSKETFSDKNGKISESSFKIPSDAKSGTWTINAKSGSNFYSIEIDVLAIAQEGMIVSVTNSPKLNGINDFINIHVYGAQQTVEIEIIAEDGEVIVELSFLASGQGEVNIPWMIPTDTEPGLYTIKVSDAYNTAEITHEIQ